jgi:hypothetical protein
MPKIVQLATGPLSEGGHVLYALDQDGAVFWLPVSSHGTLRADPDWRVLPLPVARCEPRNRRVTARADLTAPARPSQARRRRPPGEPAIV